MKIYVTSPDKLTSEQYATWSRLQQTDPTLQSPFLSPEYIQAVAAVRYGVEVGILEEEGQPVGFFPFQRHRRHIARPVGGRLCDFQAVVARKDLMFSPKDLLRGCGLTTWQFDHLVALQGPFRHYHCVVEDSPYVDLADGFEAYAQQRRQAGSHGIKRIEKQARRLQREFDAPLRCVPHTTDHDIFSALVDWKSEQYRRLKDMDYLAVDWVRRLLDRLLHEGTESCSGMLSALYVGDTLAAVHFGLRCQGVLHAWFPAYNPMLARHSPGAILRVELMKQCESLGIHRIDLGKGQQEHKLHLRSGGFPLAEGSIHLSPVTQSLNRSWLRTREWIRSTRLRAPAGASARFLRRFQAWLAAH